MATSVRITDVEVGLPELSARDALHLAILSFDAGSDVVSGMR